MATLLFSSPFYSVGFEMSYSGLIEDWSVDPFLNLNLAYALQLLSLGPFAALGLFTLSTDFLFIILQSGPFYPVLVVCFRLKIMLAY
jgi:hypothetical protein